MKPGKLLVCTVILFGFVSMLNAQNLCKVLKPEISVSYVGMCKNGLADGTGEATGEDFYKGEFVKGLPDGKGTYIWKNGATYDGEWEKGMRDGYGIYSYKFQNSDSILEGEWKNDKYLGKKALPPYVIEYRNNIGRVSCIRTGDRPYVRYVFARGGVSGLLMQGSSGTENLTTSFTGFEQVSFPFKCNLKFYAPNAWMTAMLDCELRLTINQPGAWVVNISF
jgi:hypothetical protein